MNFSLLPGMTVAPGPVLAEELSAFSGARLRLVRLPLEGSTPDTIGIWRDAGTAAFILQLLSAEVGRTPTSPQSFVDSMSNAIETFLTQGVRDVEVQDAPNRADRGCGVTWHSGQEFGAWFMDVRQLLHLRFGAALQVGFPALAPSTPSRYGPAPAIEEFAFLEACFECLKAADWAGVQLYWRNIADLRDYDGPLRFVRHYLDRFPEQVFFVTQYANVNTAASPESRGDQYVELLTLLAQYDRIIGACGFPWRADVSPDAELAWLHPDGAPRATVARVAERPKMPDRFRLQMGWPTEVRYYTQYYGENQQIYASCCGMVGGHNGVDMRVNRAAPTTSPIRACLDGTVSQVALDNTGYGHHLRIRSYGPDNEEITAIYAHLSRIDVSVGTLVHRGDVLGMAGSTGFSTGAHLHFGIRVQGIRIPAINDWLNPRPYLDPPAPGLPRTQYARTYVLLPPTADASWAVAVVAAAWDTQRFTIGGSADDAGIGELDFRRIIAVNPEEWGDDLGKFFNTHYPGVRYVPIEAASPSELTDQLHEIPALPDRPPQHPPSPRGLPRATYARTYLLLPPSLDAQWAKAAVEMTWDRYRLTVGGSADDAGIGDLESKRVIAINPDAWGEDLEAFFKEYYPGVVFSPVIAATVEDLRAVLRGIDVS
ncbi:MAG: M23 family metallopeptidase [Anaerolineae bacterium]|nr:M23 family metallopeptidase [Anaerolineae bacterium]